MPLELTEETCPGILQQSSGEEGAFWRHSDTWCGCDTHSVQSWAVEELLELQHCCAGLSPAALIPAHPLTVLSQLETGM